jgi:hypothetical protein
MLPVSAFTGIVQSIRRPLLPWVDPEMCPLPQPGRAARHPKRGQICICAYPGLSTFRPRSLDAQLQDLTPFRVRAARGELGRYT